MTSCWACETALDPAWKFCIQCGVAVTASALPKAEREQVSAYALFGWIVAGLGAALLVTGVILFLIYG